MCFQVPVPFARWEGQVFNYVRYFSDAAWSTMGSLVHLGYTYNTLQFIAVLGRFIPKLRCDATEQYAFNGAFVEVCKSHWGHTQFP